MSNSSHKAVRPRTVTLLLLLAGVCGVVDAVGLVTHAVRFNVTTLAIALVSVPLLAWGRWRMSHGHASLPWSAHVKRTLRLAGVILVCTVMVGSILPLTVIRNESNQPVEYLLILGAGLAGDEVTPTLAYRLDCGLHWLSSHPEIPIIVSGGQGRDEPRTEADAMAAYLHDKGIASARIVREDRSTNTWENMRYTSDLLRRRGRDSSRVLVATSDFHLYRSLWLAKRAGLDAYGMPCPTPWYERPNSMVRECFAILKSWALDGRRHSHASQDTSSQPNDKTR